MTTPRILEFENAATLELQLHLDTDEAALHFGRVDKPPLVVTIPLHQVGRLHERILEMLAANPTLFSSSQRPRTL